MTRKKIVTFDWYNEYNGYKPYSVSLPMAINCPSEDLAETFARMLKRCRQISNIKIQSTIGNKVTMYDWGKMEPKIKIHRPVIEFDGTITNQDNVDLCGAEALSVFLQMGRYFILWN